MNIAELRQQFPFLREFTDQEVAGYLIAAHGVTPKDPRYSSMESELLGYDRTAGEVVKDTGVGLVRGLVGVGEGVAAIGGALLPGVRAFDNPVYNTLRRAGEAVDEFKSEGLRRQELGASVDTDIAVRQAGAEGAGFWGRIAAGAGAQAGAMWENPGLAAQALVESAPSLIAGAGAGRLVQGAGQAAGLGQRAAAGVGVAGGVGTNAALQGGAVAGDTFERAREAGADYDAAADLAGRAGAAAGGATVALSAIPGARAIERSMIRGAAPAGVGRLGAAVGESVSEGIEEGFGQYAGNVAVGRVDPSADPAMGVGSAGVQGMAAAGPMGFAVGGRRAPVAAPAPVPRTEIGEIDLTGTATPAPQFDQYDTPTYMRRGLDPTFERSSPWMPPAEIQAQERQRALAEPAVPGFLQSEQVIPPYLRAEPTAADVAGPAVNPVQRGEATVADLYAPQPADPFETAGFAPPPVQPEVASAAFSPVNARPAPPPAPANAPVMIAGRDGVLPPTELPAAPEQRPAAVTAAVNQARQQQNAAGKPTVGTLLVALEKANQTLGANVIRKDGQVSQAAGTAKLRSILESKTPVEAMRQVYEDGKNPRDELLDQWHKELTGQTIAEMKAATPAPADAATVAAPEATPATPPPTAAPVAAPVQEAQIQQLAPKRPTVAERKISARVDGAGAAMDGAGMGANPHRPGTAAHKEWREGYDEVKARAEAAKPNPIAKKLVQTVETTKDESLYDESLFALYKLAANGDVTAYNYFQNNGYYDDISANGKKLKPAQAAEMRKLRERWDRERGQERGKKFGADRFRSRDSETGKAIDMPALQSVAQAVQAAVPGAPKIAVADNPAAVGLSAPGGIPMGVTTSDGRIILFREGITDRLEAMKVAFHELFHHGVGNLVPPEQYHATMDRLYAADPEVQRRAQDWIGSAEARGRQHLGMGRRDLRSTAIEEALAGIAEDLKTGDGLGSRRNKVVRSITRWMADLADTLGMKELAQWLRRSTMTEAERFVMDAVGAAGDPNGGPRGGGERFSTKDLEDKAPVKPLAEGARALTATLKAQIKGEELSESLLNFLTLRQIDEQFGKKLPALRDWVNVVMERSTNASKLAAEADRVALQWQQDVPHAEMKPLAEILLRASNAELQLDNTDAKYLASLGAEERAEHAALRAKLEALSPAAQQARKDALAVLKRQWNYTHQSLTKFITLTVADPDLRSKRLNDLQQEFGRNRGDYFPMSRFGDRVVIARGAAKDGRDIVTFHESAKAVEDEVRKLKDSGVKPDSIIVTMSTEYDPKKTPGTGFVRELHAMIDNVADGDEARQLHQSLQQLYLKSLPELSGAKHMVRRENIEGYSQDALRVFADAVTRGSRYASHLEFGPAVHAALEAAETQSRSSDRRTAAVVIGRKEGQQPVVKVVGTGTERLQAVEKMAEDGYAVEFFSAHPETVAERLAGALEAATPEELAGYVRQVRDAVKKSTEGVEDLRAAKQLYNYMVRSQKADLDPDPGKVVEIAGQLGYAWYLGFSPAFWAMNTLQNPMVGIPHLGSKYGLAKASTEWMRAAKWFATVRIGKRLASDSEPFSVEWLREQVNAGDLKGINKQELDMLQRLEDRQVLDFTQAMDLSRIGSASSSKWYKAMRLAAAGAHHTEVFNRVSFALASYRLAMKSRSDMTHEEATRAAERDVASAHFDYSYANKPLWMGKSTPALRLVFMFQQYRQHMLYWWANTIKDATKGMTPEDRSRARKAALLMGTSQLLFAGTMGLPFVGALGALVNMIAGGGEDGEEPFEFDRWMREAALGMTGSQEGADLVLKGIFAALGADISRRIGQQDLFPLLNAGSGRYERNFDDKARAYMFDMLGPLGSIALGAARATEAFSSGDYLKGLAAATPKAASDILKAYQLASEGLKDKRGQQLASEEAFDGWDAAFQAAGVVPTAVSNVKAARGEVLDIQNAFRDQSKRLVGGFIEAWMRGDNRGVTEALADIHRYNTNIAKGRTPARELLITPDRIKSAIVDRQRRAMLLALTGGLAETRQQLLIATRVSGLYDLDGRDARLDAAGLPALPSFAAGD